MLNYLNWNKFEANFVLICALLSPKVLSALTQGNYYPCGLISQNFGRTPLSALYSRLTDTQFLPPAPFKAEKTSPSRITSEALLTNEWNFASLRVSLFCVLQKPTKHQCEVSLSYSRRVRCLKKSENSESAMVKKDIQLKFGQQQCNAMNQRLWTSDNTATLRFTETYWQEVKLISQCRPGCVDRNIIAGEN